MATKLTDEQRFKIGQPDMIRHTVPHGRVNRFLKPAPRKPFSSLDEAIFRARRRRPETIPIQASRMIKQRSSVMPTIFDLLYREYCRARLAEMRQQLLIQPESHEVLESNCDDSGPDCAAGGSRLDDSQRDAGHRRLS
jgi:hypothetical protein